MRPIDDSAFDAAWRVFAREEARAAAAPDLEQRVLARVVRRTEPRAEAERVSRWRWPALAAAAATMVLAAAVVLWFGRERPQPVPARATWDHLSDVALRAPVTGRRLEAG